jgi:hypothetical protein
MEFLRAIWDGPVLGIIAATLAIYLVLTWKRKRP